MPTEYELSNGLQERVGELLSTCEDFNALRDTDVAIGCCFRIKLNKDDEMVASGPASDLKRVSPLMRAFFSFDFVVVVDQYVWNNVSGVAQNAMLHSALMRAQVEVAGQGTKIRMRKPDVVEFSQTLRRFGLYKEECVNLRDLLQGAALNVAAALGLQSTPDSTAPVELRLVGTRTGRRARARSRETVAEIMEEEEV